MIATDYIQLDKTHRPCGGTIQPSYRLAPMQECETCGATGTAPGGLGICNDCGSNEWLVAHLGPVNRILRMIPDHRSREDLDIVINCQHVFCFSGICLATACDGHNGAPVQLFRD
jgi:hypothetical protein